MANMARYGAVAAFHFHVGRAVIETEFIIICRQAFLQCDNREDINAIILDDPSAFLRHGKFRRGSTEDVGVEYRIEADLAERKGGSIAAHSHDLLGDAILFGAHAKHL